MAGGGISRTDLSHLFTEGDPEKLSVVIGSDTGETASAVSGDGISSVPVYSPEFSKFTGLLQELLEEQKLTNRYLADIVGDILEL